MEKFFFSKWDQKEFPTVPHILEHDSEWASHRHSDPWHPCRGGCVDICASLRVLKIHKLSSNTRLMIVFLVIIFIAFEWLNRRCKGHRGFGPVSWVVAEWRAAEGPGETVLHHLHNNSFCTVCWVYECVWWTEVWEELLILKQKGKWHPACFLRVA